MVKIIREASKTIGGAGLSLLINAASVKLLAILLGPTGIGLFSILRQFQQTTVVVGTLGGQTALVQGISRADGEEERKRYIATVFLFFLAMTLLVSIFVILGAPILTQWVFGESAKSSYVVLIRLIGLSSAFGAFFAFFAGIINGYRAIGRLAIAQVVGAITMLLLVYPLGLFVRSGYEIGLILLIVFTNLSMFLYTFWIAFREGWIPSQVLNLFGGYDAGSANHFLKIAISTFLTGLFAKGSILFLRGVIVREWDLTQAGIFDAAWTMSQLYVMVILTSFGTYYLPTLTATKDQNEIKLLIRRLIRFSVFLIVPLILAVIILKPLMIRILFSEDFLTSLTIFRWMLIGDFFKVTSWVLAMPMLAFADMRAFILTELGWSGGFALLSYFTITITGDIQFIGISFAVMYFLYLVAAYLYSYYTLSITMSRRIVIVWVTGLCLILGASIIEWNVQSLKISLSYWLIFPAIFVMYWALTHEEKHNLASWVYGALARFL